MTRPPIATTAIAERTRSVARQPTSKLARATAPTSTHGAAAYVAVATAPEATIASTAMGHRRRTSSGSTTATQHQDVLAFPIGVAGQEREQPEHDDRGHVEDQVAALSHRFTLRPATPPTIRLKADATSSEGSRRGDAIRRDEADPARGPTTGRAASARASGAWNHSSAFAASPSATPPTDHPPSTRSTSTSRAGPSPRSWARRAVASPRSSTWSAASTGPRAARSSSTACAIDRLSEANAARFRRTRVGFVFQFFHLLDDLSVRDNVAVAAQLAGASGRSARRDGR